MAWANHLGEILHTTKGRRTRARLDAGFLSLVSSQHAGHHVVGVDISAIQISRAKELVPGGEFFRVDIRELVKGTAEPEVQNGVSNAGKFDAVVALYLLIHMPVEEQVVLMEQLGNWVKPGGYCMMSVGITAWAGEESVV